MAENCKISEITKYGEKMPKIANNVKMMPKTGQNGQTMVTFQFFYFQIFWLETTPKMILAIFTQSLVPEIQISGHFCLKSAFLGPQFLQLSQWL